WVAAGSGGAAGAGGAGLEVRRDVGLDRALRTAGVARAERVEQLTVLLDDGVRVLVVRRVTDEVRADARLDEPPDLQRLRVARGGDHRLVELEVQVGEATGVEQIGRAHV